jgi:hypothetical protein
MAEIGYTRAIFFAGVRVWGLAILEIIVVAGVSLVPLFGAALREVLPTDSTIYLSDAFEKTFLSGQLLFYSLGLIATITWHSNKDFKSFFPLRAVFNLFSLIGVGGCLLIIGFDPTFNETNKVFLARFSVGLFLASIILYITMAVINQVHFNVGKALAETDAALGEAVRRSRGLE